MKTYLFMVLSVLFAFLLSLNTIKVFSLDEISFFITVIGLIYGLIAAFTINNSWERFSKIRDAISQEMNSLTTAYIYAKQLSDRRAVALLQRTIIAYCDDVPQVDWGKYWKSERTHALFRSLITIVAEMKLKSTKDVELFDEVSEELRNASTARNTQLILAQTKISITQWTLNIFLSLILVIGLVFLSIPNYALSLFIVTSMVAAVCLILVVIYELDSMRFAEREISCEPYAGVIRVVSEGLLEPNIDLWYKNKSALPPTS